VDEPTPPAGGLGAGGRAPAQLVWAQVDAWRLERQHLRRRAPASALESVVADVLGLHAQLATSAELSAANRVEALARDALEEALVERRTLVKTWVMRGTLHLVTAAEFPELVAALMTRSPHRSGAWLRGHGVTAEQMEALLTAVPEVVDETPRTREELADALASRVGEDLRELLRSGWGALLKPAAFHGLLSFGPNQGQRVTFVRPDRWLGEGTAAALSRPAGPDAAVVAILRRFLHAYGPATDRAFEHWWGARPPAGKRRLRALGDEVVPAEVDGWRAWCLAEDVEAIERTAPLDPEAPVVRLLPAFDPYVLGYHPRSRLVPDARAPRVFRAQGWISPVVLVDGIAAGTWTLRRGNGTSTATIEPFHPLPPAVLGAIDREADALGSFLGTPISLSFTA
jgi:hypothetical protein